MSPQSVIRKLSHTGFPKRSRACVLLAWLEDPAPPCVERPVSDPWGAARFARRIPITLTVVAPACLSGIRWRGWSLEPGSPSKDCAHQTLF